jgi:rRNA maturation endonuclease Nob1
MIVCRDCERRVDRVAPVFGPDGGQICPWCGGDVKELPEEPPCDIR